MSNLNDNAVVKVSTAHFYYAEPGTTRPTSQADLISPPAEWTEFGHTTLENIVNLTSEGGASTILGSLQNRNLRQSIESRVEAFGFSLLEWTEKSAQFYYGANAVLAEDGAIEVPLEPVPTEKALLIVLIDGAMVSGFHSLKASIFRSDDLAVSDTNSLAALPIKATAMSWNGSPSAYAVILPKAAKTAAKAVATVAAGAVDKITVTNPGAGYATAPTVTLTGAGSGAVAIAVLTGGQVSAINVTTPGTGYTTAPTVVVAAP